MILEPRKKRSQQGVCKIPPFVGLGKEDRNNSLHTECRELFLEKKKETESLASLRARCSQYDAEYSDNAKEEPVGLAQIKSRELTVEWVL